MKCQFKSCCKHPNLSILTNSDTGVGGAKVDTNSALLCHFAKLSKD